VFFPLWSFPFLLEKKQSKQTTRETTNALPELRERERKRFIKRRRETERDLVALSRRKKEERCVVSFPPLLLKRLRRYPRQRGVSLRKTKINRSNRISSPEEEEEEKERGKKNLRKNERERNKDPPHHVDVDACVCVLFLLLCPRLNVRLQFVWMRYVVVVLRQSFIQKVGRPFVKKVNQNENFKKKTSNNQTTVADRRTQIIIIISRCTWIY
jgi:hypothetical protein